MIKSVICQNLRVIVALAQRHQLEKFTKDIRNFFVKFDQFQF